MSGIMLRISLVIILCIQVVLWSQTRQAELQVSPISYPASLWRRSVLDANQTDLLRTVWIPFSSTYVLANID
jgi:hypothetical protein